MTLLHTQYEMDGDPVLFQCAECGYVEQSLGALHAHIEAHRGYTRWGIQVPFTSTAMANGEELMKRTEVLRVRDTETVELSDVPGFDERQSVLRRLLAPLRRVFNRVVG